MLFSKGEFRSTPLPRGPDAGDKVVDKQTFLTHHALFRSPRRSGTGSVPGILGLTQVLDRSDAPAFNNLAGERSEIR